MRPGGGHAKGASFERKACRELSLWLSEGKNDDLFWRSAMSGGRATVQFKKGRENRSQVGDLSPISSKGETLTDLCIFECKFYRDLQMIGLYLGLKTGINKHWKELQEDASLRHKWPVLIARQNRTPTFMCLSTPAVEFFSLESAVIAFFPALDLNLLWYDVFLQNARRP